MPTQIVDLTTEADLRDMYSKAKHEKRVAFDLDEVVFCHDENPDRMEKFCPSLSIKSIRSGCVWASPPCFIISGIRAYDVWVYTSNYYSMDCIRNMFRHYHVQVAGIVTGMSRIASKDTQKRESLEKQFKDLYTITVHADRKTLVYVNNRTKAFEEHPLSGDAQWSAAIIDIIREISDHEKKNANG